MWRSTCLLTFFFVSLCKLPFAQVKSDIIQQRIEFISEQSESEEMDLTNVVEALTFYAEHPLNLNTATFDELAELSLLTDIQISELVLHIRLYGKLLTIYELQTLSYWDMETIQRVLPFVRVDDRLDNLHVSFKEALKQGEFEWTGRYQRIPEQKVAYKYVPDSVLKSGNTYYYGNPDHYYTRLRYSYRTNLSVGITAEKDPGEEFFKGSQRQGFDFYSAHAFYKGGKYIKSVALGDYQVQIGQGLALWTGYAFGKTSDITSIKKNAIPLRPYTSVDETRFLRGAAVDFGLGPFSLLLFASRKKVDATLTQDSLNTTSASSFNLAGLHRTTSEIARKNEVTENLAGANLRFVKRNLQLGFAGVYQGYDTDYTPSLFPYNQFKFRGKELISWSADYAFVLRNFNFFGEASRASFNSQWATIHGVVISPDSRASFSLLYRDYQRGYNAFYSNGFSEGSTTQNEKGAFVGLRIKLNSEWSVQSYADLFSFPWMKYLVDAPSTGNEILIQPTYKPTKQLEIYGRFRQQTRQKNTREEESLITPIEDVVQRNYRLNLTFAVSENLTLKSRVEYLTIHRPSAAVEQGVVVSQDILFKPKSLPFDISMRYALFDTDSYDSRIYTFENNALNVFSTPAYYYRGNRMYLMVRYSFFKSCDVWLRYGTFSYNGRSFISSGSEQIKGSHKSDITLQLRVRL
jgi:hypothetical protein